MARGPYGDDNPDNFPNDPDPAPPDEHDCDDSGGSFIKPLSEWFKPNPEEPKSDEGSRRTRYGTGPDSGYSEGSPESRG